MKGIRFLALPLLVLAASLVNLEAQSLRGFYTGQLKLAANGAKLSAQLDLMEDSGRYSAVLRSRVVEGLSVSGCDNWLEGKMNEGRLDMINQVPLRETNVPRGACSGFIYTKFSVKYENGTYVLNGNLNDAGGDFYGKITLTRMDTVLSFSVEEEAAEANRKKGEVFIASALNDKDIIDRMLSVRPAQLLDSVSLVPINASLKVEAPDADIFHKLTVTINGNPVLTGAIPRQQGAIIRLKDMAPGDVDVFFLCYHLLVDAWFNVKLTLTWEGGEKIWTIPVSTLRNSGILLRVLPLPAPG